MIKELSLVLLVYILIRIYLWYRKRIHIFKTFSRNGIPGPKPKFISGNYYEFKENPNNTLEEWIQEYGNVFGYFNGIRPILVINDLDTIREILIKKCKIFRDRPMFSIKVKPLVSSLLALRGDRWRHVRRVMTPSLAHNKITSKEIIEIINNSIDLCIDQISEEKVSEVEVVDKMQSITLDVVCKSVLNMYDTDIHTNESQLKKFVKEYMNSARNVLVVSANFFSFLGPILAFLNNYVTAGRMTNLILKHLNKQIESESQDFITNYEISKSNNVLKALIKCLIEKQLEKEEVTGNALVLLLAGYDTTSMGLTSALYCLAKNPEIQERLRNEVILKGSDAHYLNMVWNETLRLFPPVATIIQREASEDITINDIRIEKGISVQVPVWQIQHDPSIWPQPYKFDPQRFDKDKGKQWTGFLPFGLGPRTCIGIELAALEARLTLSKIVTNFRVEVCDKTPENIQFICPTDILYPKNPIYLKFVSLNV